MQAGQSVMKKTKSRHKEREWWQAAVFRWTGRPFQRGGPRAKGLLMYLWLTFKRYGTSRMFKIYQQYFWYISVLTWKPMCPTSLNGPPSLLRRYLDLKTMRPCLSWFFSIFKIKHLLRIKYGGTCHPTVILLKCFHCSPSYGPQP